MLLQTYSSRFFQNRLQNVSQARNHITKRGCFVIHFTVVRQIVARCFFVPVALTGAYHAVHITAPVLQTYFPINQHCAVICFSSFHPRCYLYSLCDALTVWKRQGEPHISQVDENVKDAIQVWTETKSVFVYVTGTRLFINVATMCIWDEHHLFPPLDSRFDLNTHTGKSSYQNKDV